MRTRRQNFFLILVLGILNTLTPFSIDMYLPAFPQIANDLSTSLARVSLSVSFYFIGFAFGQILYGPLLDRFGRKPPLYVGLSLYVISSIGCAMSASIDSLLVFRMLTALGGCVASVGSTAMVRDFFPAKDSAKVFSLLMLVLSVSPLLAPTIGSLVIVHFGWRMVFHILTAFAVLVLILVRFALPVGYTADRSFSLAPGQLVSQFLSVLKVKQFLMYTLAGSFSFASLFIYIAGSPAIFMDGFHVSPQVYGVIFAFLAVGMIGGGQVNLLLTKRFSSEQIFRTAISLQVVFALIFLVGTAMGGYSLVATIALIFAVISCAGITYPNAASLALAPFSTNLGTAASLMGFLQFGSGSVLSAILGAFEAKGTLPTAFVMALGALLALAILLFGREKRA